MWTERIFPITPCLAAFSWRTYSAFGRPARHFSEQKRTASQSRAHFFRQLNSRPQAAQTFRGRSCLRGLSPFALRGIHHHRPRAGGGRPGPNRRAPAPLKAKGRSISTGCRKAGGGAEGNRTPDLLIANEALSQLSYSPALRRRTMLKPRRRRQGAPTPRQLEHGLHNGLVSMSDGGFGGDGTSPPTLPAPR